MKTINQLINFRLIAILFTTLAIVSCGDDDAPPPDVESVPDIITDVTFIFTPVDGGPVWMTFATDPDADGTDFELAPVPQAAILLEENTEYILTYVITNRLASSSENIALEIEEGSDEYQFFYSFSENFFSSPIGDGNIDNRIDPVNYLDEDDNGLDVGLRTSWTSGAAPDTGFLTIVLKNQPNLKTETSGADVGSTEFNLTFSVIFQ